MHLPFQQKMVRIYRLRREKRLSRPSWLVIYLDDLPVQVLTGPDVD